MEILSLRLNVQAVYGNKSTLSIWDGKCNIFAPFYSKDEAVPHLTSWRLVFQEATSGGNDFVANN
jgi:hypothetical protein